jgi:hypothetical protein
MTAIMTAQPQNNNAANTWVIWHPASHCSFFFSEKESQTEG